jgi:uncharacterized protein with HEPN domain
MDREVRKLLRDALDATREILEYTGTVSAQQFATDRMRQRATYFAFAVLGEALNKLLQEDDSYASSLTDVRMSIDMRNRLIHGYSSIDSGIVWATAIQDIPNLRDELQSLLDTTSD